MFVCLFVCGSIKYYVKKKMMGFFYFASQLKVSFRKIGVAFIRAVGFCLQFFPF